MFVQIHTLHSYPAALLNRDDSGLAKQMMFGGVQRTRISSQCLKRHWRTHESDLSLSAIDGLEDAIRSRNIIDRKVMPVAIERSGCNEEVAKAATDALNAGLYGASGLQTSGRQPLLLGLAEIRYLQERAVKVCAAHPEDAEQVKSAISDIFGGKQEADNFRAFRAQTKLPGGLTSALFGRMMTSDPSANMTAAVNVQHALTVHRAETEQDYFSVVEELAGDDEHRGSAHMGNTELTAGLFYGYVVIDVPGLVSNLEGCERADWRDEDRALAAEVASRLVGLIATVSPGAKLGSTAPYAYADHVLVEIGARQPRSLANAFRRPVEPQLEAAVTALHSRLSTMDAKYDYGRPEARRMTTMTAADDIPGNGIPDLTMSELTAWLAESVRAGQAVA